MASSIEATIKPVPEEKTVHKDDVVSRTIALAKERQSQHNAQLVHPLSAGLFGNNENIQTLEDNMNKTKNATKPLSN
jgi:hypothetical protein